MIHVTCSKCDQALTEHGALIFGPPDIPAAKVPSVDKIHLCLACFKELVKWIYPHVYP